MSTSVEGAASRMFSSGTRLWPPASTLAPSSAARASSACWRPCGRTNANGAGFTSLLVGLGSMARMVGGGGRERLRLVGVRAADDDHRAAVVLVVTDEACEVVAPDGDHSAERDPGEGEVVRDLQRAAAHDAEDDPRRD